MSETTPESQSGPDEELFAAAGRGDVPRLIALLDRHPDKLRVGFKPYGHTLLHAAAQHGHLGAVDVLLRRGLDANVREQGDYTYPMHWAAAAGRLDIVKRLADAGGDVIGHGDDHQLEVIGWATCWDGCHDAEHRAVADFLVSRGARHHIFSAIALNLGAEVRRIAARDATALARRMSRNEDFQRPLHFAVRMNRPEMVALLLELGADSRAPDGSGYPPAFHAASADVDRGIIAALAHRHGHDLFTALATGEWATAEQLHHRDGPVDPAHLDAGVLHLLAKRGDRAAVEWLLAHGADPNRRWLLWDAVVTPLHMAAAGGNPDVIRVLLDAGADPALRDSKHDGDALGWAEHFGRVDAVRLLRARAGGSPSPTGH
jgi:ankyrin repeat protein